MVKFRVKRVQTSLFGVVEAANKDPWWRTFSGSGSTFDIELDGEAVVLIAEQLELHAKCLAGDALEYVRGEYHPKTRGMGGSQLGNFGEVLTYLLNRGMGRGIVRVVSWRPGGQQERKGSRFPQPDFLIQQDEEMGALEVKSTEAFDFLKLRNTTKKWTLLQPCEGVARCRSDALPQLGYSNGVVASQQHSLVVRGGTVVPFPVGRGEAVAVLAVDGRSTALREYPKYKTPKSCREAKRNCWTCVDDSDVVVVEMPNAPGRLSLAGGSERGSGAWFQAYQRWGQALAIRDVQATSSALSELSNTTLAWLDERDDQESARVLRAFWGSYLQDAMRTRGIAVEVEGFGRLDDEGRDLDWTPVSLAEPTVREASFSELVRVANLATADVPVRISARLEGDEFERGSVALAMSPESIEVTLTSKAWWERRAVETDEDASRVAAQLVDIAVRLAGYRAQLPFVRSLRALKARVGDGQIRIGWAPKRGAPDSRQWHRFARLGFGRPLRPLWSMLLFLGDSRVRLYVLPDGRARLRIARSVW